MIPEDYVWLNPNIHKEWLFTPDKIERQPELLEIPLKNIARWIAMGRLGDKPRVAPSSFLGLVKPVRYPEGA